MARYVESALTAREAGTAVPLATVRVADGAVVGASRFFDIERWSWPPGHPAATHAGPDGCEIGYTWLAPAAMRTAANTEAKLLLLTHAFEVWGVQRVCFHTDVRNERSRAALPPLRRRPDAARFGALLDRGGGVAGCEGAPARAAGSCVIVRGRSGPAFPAPRRQIVDLVNYIRDSSR